MASTPGRDKIIDRVLDGIENGITLAELCRTESIGRRTFYDWLDADSALAARFARAREIGFDVIAEETLDIAEDGRNDWVERNIKGQDKIVLNEEHVARSRLRIDTRLKLLAKWDPKRYGERTTIAGDPEAPLVPAAESPASALAAILDAARQRRENDGSDLA